MLHVSSRDNLFLYYTTWAPTHVGKWGARGILTIITKEFFKSSIVAQKVGGGHAVLMREVPRNGQGAHNLSQLG